MTNQGYIAVVGAGYWGQNHVRNFRNLGVLRTVCDSRQEALDRTIRKYPDIHGTLDFLEVILDSGIRGIVIATQADTHYGLALQALTGGKDVLVEKPMALTVREARHLHRTASSNNRILMVGHILLYHPAILTIKDYVARGELGEIYYIYSNRLNLGKIRHEENILWSFAPHDISVILDLIGEKPLEVRSTGEAYLQPNIHDVTMTSMKFRSGAMAYIHVSWLHPFKEHRLVIVGSKKMMVFEDTAQGGHLRLYDQRVDIVRGVPEVVRSNGVPVEYPAEEPLQCECLHFLESVKTRTQPRSDGQNGIDVLEVLERAQQDLDGSMKERS